MKVNLGGTALLYSSSCIGKHIVRVFLLLFAFVGLFDSARSQSTGIVTGLSPAGDGSFKDGVLVLVEELRRDNDNIKQPLFRCFEREVSGGKQLLRKVRRALTLVIGVCNGDKQSNKGRALLHDILMATIPHAWRRYTVPVGLALPEWMVDFTARMTQLQSISAGVEQGELLQDIWLGGLMYPEAYITATRQAVAQANKWSLEELSLQLQLDVSDGSATSGFMVTSLYIDGAKPDPQAGLSLDTRGSVEMMSKNKLVWIHESSNTAAQTSDHLTLPLYLNHSRQNLLSTAAVHCSIPQVKVYQRAVALYASVVGK